MLTLWRHTPRPLRSAALRLTLGRLGFVTGVAVGVVGPRVATRLLRRRARRGPSPALLAVTGLVVVLLGVLLVLLG